MQAISNTEGVTLGDIATSVSLSQATVSSILDRLEKRGLICRKRSTVDKRRIHAYLTDQGLQVLRDAPLPLQEQFSRQFVDLQEWEQNMIISALQRVAQMMDAEHIDASPILDVGTLDRPGESVEQ
jgi:DNA-binding MarR family transcriptional regulator